MKKEKEFDESLKISSYDNIRMNIAVNENAQKEKALEPSCFVYNAAIKHKDIVTGVTVRCYYGRYMGAFARQRINLSSSTIRGRKGEKVAQAWNSTYEYTVYFKKGRYIKKAEKVAAHKSILTALKKVTDVSFHPFVDRAYELAVTNRE